MKSAGAFIGIFRIRELCRELEALGAAGGIAGAGRLLHSNSLQHYHL
jgi:hypothetical protein